VLNDIFCIFTVPWNALRQARGELLAFIQLASIRLWLRVNETTPWPSRISTGDADTPSEAAGATAR
jgi:hypothetical protein